MNLRDEIRRRFGEQPPGTAEAAGNLEAALEEARRAKAQLAEVQAELAEARSEEHTSELQSQSNLVCRLLLEKQKKINTPTTTFPILSHWLTALVQLTSSKSPTVTYLSSPTL